MALTASAAQQTPNKDKYAPRLFGTWLRKGETVSRLDQSETYPFMTECLGVNAHSLFGFANGHLLRLKRLPTAVLEQIPFPYRFCRIKANADNILWMVLESQNEGSEPNDSHFIAQYIWNDNLVLNQEYPRYTRISTILGQIVVSNLSHHLNVSTHEIQTGRLLRSGGVLRVCRISWLWGLLSYDVIEYSGSFLRNLILGDLSNYIVLDSEQQVILIPRPHRAHIDPPRLLMIQTQTLVSLTFLENIDWEACRYVGVYGEDWLLREGDYIHRLRIEGSHWRRVGAVYSIPGLRQVSLMGNALYSINSEGQSRLFSL